MDTTLSDRARTASTVDRVILGDFDGTLAYRPGMWRSALVEVLDEHEPGHGVHADAFKPFLRDRFPWHRPLVPHPELSTPEAWWRAVEPLLARAFEGVGFSPDRSVELARYAHYHYVNPAGFHLFEDTRGVLEWLASAGWQHVVLSNHVPELAGIVEGVGLGDLIMRVVSSAVIGFEKPHLEAFRIALRMAGNPAWVWMVGDNPEADVRGAEAVGIPAILVRNDDPGIRRRAADLDGVVEWIEAEMKTQK